MAAPRRWLALVMVIVLLVSGFGALVAAGDSSSDPAVDVVFLVDRSPSMENQSAATTSSAMTFAQGLESRSVDGRYAVIAYANDRWTTLQTAPTSDLATLEDGLESIAYGRNSSEDASSAILRALDDERDPVIEHRADATTVFVVITDEDDDGYCEVGAEATEAVDAHDAVLVALAMDPPFAPDGPGAPCLDDPSQNDLRTIAEEQVERGVWIDPDDPDFEPAFELLELSETTPTATPTPELIVSTASPTPEMTPTATPVPTSTASPEETEVATTSTATVTPTPSDAVEDTPTTTEPVDAQTQPTTSIMTDAGIGLALLVGGTLAAALLMVGIRRYR